MAILVGTAAMGPLYVAFPLGVSLLKKGSQFIQHNDFSRRLGVDKDSDDSF